MSVTGYIFSALMKHWSYDPGLLIQGPPEKTVKRAVSSDKSVEGEQFEGGEGRPRSTIHITDCLRRMQAGAWGLLWKGREKCPKQISPGTSRSDRLTSL